MAKKGNDFVDALAILAGVALVGGVVAYAITGRDPVEEQIDKLVSALNRTFGKGWGGLAINAIKGVLGNTVTAELLAFVEVIHRVERYGTQQGWTGLQKRGSATASLRAAA